MTLLVLFVGIAILGFLAGWLAGTSAVCHSLRDDIATLDAERTQLDLDRRAHLETVEAWLDVEEPRIAIDLRPRGRRLVS